MAKKRISRTHLQASAFHLFWRGDDVARVAWRLGISVTLAKSYYDVYLWGEKFVDQAEYGEEIREHVVKDLKEKCVREADAFLKSVPLYAKRLEAKRRRAVRESLENIWEAHRRNAILEAHCAPILDLCDEDHVVDIVAFPFELKDEKENSTTISFKDYSFFNEQSMTRSENDARNN